MNSNHVHGANGTTAAVTKVHCLRSVSHCSAIGWEKLQASHDMRTLPKFYVLLGKSALEFYKPLKESLGTHAPSYDTVH
jgi:hypothetical protein